MKKRTLEKCPQTKISRYESATYKENAVKIKKMRPDKKADIDPTSDPTLVSRQECLDGPLALGSFEFVRLLVWHRASENLAESR